MLEILNAIQFNTVFSQGGRTKPWLVQVLVQEQRVPYVVKLFTTDEVDYENTVAREVFGSALATEFDIPVPAPALINFTNEFINTLPENILNDMLFRDNRLKFGCFYLENTTLLEPDLPSFQVKKFINDIATIYAFDTLINNKDRGNFKTNILISNESNNYFIFDHERAFKRIDYLVKEIEKNQFSEILNQHVFYKYLLSKKNKSDLFDTFHTYLRHLNVNVLDSYNSFLMKYDLQHQNYNQLMSYLYQLKQKADWFVNVLVNSVSK